MLVEPSPPHRPPPARGLLLYNQPVLPARPPDAESEHEGLYTLEQVEKALAGADHSVRRLGLSRDPGRLVPRLRQERPDVVFNLFEGLADHYETEAHVAGVLDWLRIPYTGSPYAALCMARNKALTKH